MSGKASIDDSGNIATETHLESPFSLAGLLTACMRGFLMLSSISTQDSKA